MTADPTGDRTTDAPTDEIGLAYAALVAEAADLRAAGAELSARADQVERTARVLVHAYRLGLLDGGRDRQDPPIRKSAVDTSRPVDHSAGSTDAQATADTIAACDEEYQRCLSDAATTGEVRPGDAARRTRRCVEQHHRCVTETLASRPWLGGEPAGYGRPGKEPLATVETIWWR